MASEFENWATRLRFAWMGASAKRIIGGIAAILGDKSVTWARQAQLEHMPEYAEDAASLVRIGAERGIERGPDDTDATYATRLTYARILDQLRGRPIGLALALHYGDFPGFVIVQQNGRYWKLDGTPVLEDLVDAVGPPDWVDYGDLGEHENIEGDPPWWTFDSDRDFCSRFAVIFPGTTYPSSFTTWGTATFTGSEQSVPITWNNEFPDATYHVLVGPARVADNYEDYGPVSVAADLSTRTATGISITTASYFAGTVDVLAWQDGENPFADPHPTDLARLRRLIRDWRPAKATCVGIYVVVQGVCWGWPVGTWDDEDDTWGACTVVEIDPEA